MIIKSINPATDTLIQTYIELSKQEIQQKITATEKAWEKWRKVSYADKAALMLKLATVLKSKKEDLARVMTLEMGKPLKESIAELEKCASVCEYYAENTETFLKDKIVKTDANKSYISYQPIGVILAVMPWNFPFWQVFRFLAPNLMAGNCGVLKHASNVSGCALLIEELVLEAGFPENVFSTLLVAGKNVNQIIEHPIIKAVTLTGSTEAGKKVAEKAGSVLKKCVLELGGSDAYLILEDADLEMAAEACVNARLINNGQSCIAAKRFIVIESVLEEFTQLLLTKIKAKKTGDPFDENTDLGPMANKQLRDDLHEQVRKSISLGAKCILGGEIPVGEGAFYPASILTNVKKGMPAFDEELFGPVAVIISADTIDEAINIANDSVFGLGGAVFTKDETKGNEIARNQLQAGSVFVNQGVKSDPRLPFGGIKQSGYGRELGLNGLLEFMNIKTISIK
ncbi:NAD-dependent succinate-semialdehyde dehydrogenase [Pedobacter arcticus]|uniref:NAD-dependent succinate-semialdehyde dehydrogenase n=1 Tax=Pedobacter arcticus TaxID=752140 RepID=UPI0003057C31|nr:NAD-dependent succinate-semialdehyde dehydrogenase [Pedobacter arcticus]